MTGDEATGWAALIIVALTIISILICRGKS